MQPIILLDHSNVAMRAFYGTFRPGLPVLSSRHGFPTNCIATWASSVDSIVRRFKPSRLIIVIDGKPTRRLGVFPSYKAGRLVKPDALTRQLPVLSQIVQDSGLEFCCQDDEEADDLIGTLARRLSDGAPVLIASADKDFSQCVTERVRRLVPAKGGDWTIMGESEILLEYNVLPTQFAQYLALMGDTSDNIPGITGIGPGKAAKILAGQPSEDEIIDRTAAMKKCPREQVADRYRLSLSLSRVIEVADVQVRRGTNPNAAFDKLDELECRRAAQIFDNLLNLGNPTAQAAPALAASGPKVAHEEQGMLF